MMLRRSRHIELDKFRIFDIDFCGAWFLFFRTPPPAIHPDAVFFTEDELRVIEAGEMPASIWNPGKVEPRD